MNPLLGMHAIYDPVFHNYVDVRSERGQRLYATYARLNAARQAPRKRIISRNGEKNSKRKR